MPDEDAVAALAEHTTPLATLDPAADRDDLAPVVEHLRGADAVGLGEATHGTREFVRLKHRLVRALVERLGFRTVALEADSAATLAVDDYVRRGVGDPESALASLTIWPWKVEGMAALVRWLRAFNEARPPDDRVRVRGISPADPGAAAERLLSSLRGVDPALVEAVGGELQRLAAEERPDDDGARRERVATGLRVADDVLTRLDEHREAHVAARSSAAVGSGVKYDRARHLCRAVEHGCEWYRTRYDHGGPHPEGMAERDRLMAETVVRCRERDPGAGVAVWAHNGHVERGTFDDGTAWAGVETMGHHLARTFGDRYRPLGFDVGRGRFRAVADVDDPDERVPRTFPAGDPLDGTATAHFDALGSAPRFVDLAAAGDDPTLAAWFDGERRIRHVGSVYDPDATPDANYLRTDLREAFDGLLFVEAGTPTVPLTRP